MFGRATIRLGIGPHSLWSPYVIGQTIIFSSCFFLIVALWNRADHYVFALWFLSSIFFSNLSGRTVDAYDTSTHDVVLVPI